MVATAENHQTFVQSAIWFLRKYNFHGLDVDWEYPVNCGSPADTKQLFTVLLKDYAMNYWKNQGAPAEELMVGFGAYASTFTLTNPASHGLDAPTSGPGTARSYTQEAGSLAYFEVCSFLKGATEVWNTPQEVPYAYKGNQWIGYANPKSFTLKVSWGSMVWNIGLDDFTGTFCGQGKYPFMHALKSALSVSTPTSFRSSTYPSMSTGNWHLGPRKRDSGGC
uniref:GH18 domain-containing protein n=1 Tax=Phocoena sinus TaxID=42100 RepID=A0A8C9CFL8_PHOSS